MWTDDQWEDIELEAGYNKNATCYPPQCKKIADKIVFRGVIMNDKGNFTNTSTKVRKNRLSA